MKKIATKAWSVFLSIVLAIGVMVPAVSYVSPSGEDAAWADTFYMPSPVCPSCQCIVQEDGDFYLYHSIDFYADTQNDQYYGFNQHLGHSWENCQLVIRGVNDDYTETDILRTIDDNAEGKYRCADLFGDFDGDRITVNWVDTTDGTTFCNKSITRMITQPATPKSYLTLNSPSQPVSAGGAKIDGEYWYYSGIRQNAQGANEFWFRDGPSGLFKDTDSDTLTIGDQSETFYCVNDGYSIEGSMVIPTETGTYPVSITNQNGKVLYTANIVVSEPVPSQAAPNSDTYKLYKLFDVDQVSYNEEGVKTASGITFAHDNNGMAYMQDIDLTTFGASNTSAMDNAQKKAEVIAANIVNGSALSYDDFGHKFARDIMDKVSSSGEIHANETIEVSSGPGYYLLVDPDYLNGENTAASSPIFVLIGEGDNEIYEKSALPSLHFFVQEDSKVGDQTNGWGKEADNTTMTPINFKAVGTLPDNLDAFGSYSYDFHLTNGGELTYPGDLPANTEDEADITGQVKITIDGTEIPKTVRYINDETGEENVKVNWEIQKGEKGEYDFYIRDLLSLGVDVNKNSEIVLEYTSQMLPSPSKVVSPVMELKYSNNPMNTYSTGNTTPEKVDIYHYSLNIEKKDKNTGEALKGVGFTVKNKDGKYIARANDNDVADIPHNIDVNYSGIPSDLIPADAPKNVEVESWMYDDDQLKQWFEENYPVPGYHVEYAWVSSVIHAYYVSDTEAIALMSLDDTGDYDPLPQAKALWQAKNKAYYVLRDAQMDYGYVSGNNSEPAEIQAAEEALNNAQANYDAAKAALVGYINDPENGIYPGSTQYQYINMYEPWTVVLNGVDQEALNNIDEKYKDDFYIDENGKISFDVLANTFGSNHNQEAGHTWGDNGGYDCTPEEDIYYDFSSSAMYMAQSRIMSVFFRTVEINNHNYDKANCVLTLDCSYDPSASASSSKPAGANDPYLFEQDDEFIFYTDENGMINLYGIDADEYIIEEVFALTNYDELGDTFTVSYDADDRANLNVGLSTTQTDFVKAQDSDDWDASVLVLNVKQIGLPSTGALGLGLLLLIAITAAGIYGGRAAIKRRQDEAQPKIMYID